MEDATLVFEKGKVIAVGKDVAIPKNAVVIEAKGKFIYPSFIDLDSDYGMPKVEQRERQFGGKPQYESNRKGAFGWNDAIRSDINASSVFFTNEDAAKELRGLGFGTVLSHQHDGITRGTSALVCLGLDENIVLIRSNAAAHYSFNKGSSSQTYPSSLLGSIALLRQTYYDAQWYGPQTPKAGSTTERNLSLEAFNSFQDLPQIFETGDKWSVLRADKVGDEFNTQYIFRSNGNEYQRLNEIKATGGSFILPLNFPDAYDVSDPYLTRMVSTEEMKHWELAPSNCAMMVKEQIPIALTLSGLQDKSVFMKNLRKAISRGLSEQEALRSLTHTPASLIKAENEIGSLKNGTWANFIITSENIFEEGAVIHENWVQGEQYIIESSDKINLAGNYNLGLPKHTYELTVTGEPGKPKAEILYYSLKKNDDGTTKPDTTKYSVNISQNGQLITLTFEAKDDFYKGVLRLGGDVDVTNNVWKGKGQAPEGEWFEWISTPSTSSKAIPKSDEKKDKAKKDSTAAAMNEKFGDIIYPFVAYGWREKPKQETVLIKNATVWTCEAEGKIENGQVLINGGKIVAVGKSVDASAFPNARIIDANGKHVSPGIINEHSHIALESVNEGGQASSAEVEEASVVWPEDINIYRQLSGGVTASQLLHGSANPIGGQSALVKMHWGGNADDMLIDNADGFIKFALGENVKQSNWGDNVNERFPQTRMGVEQIYYDLFIRAREYGEEWRNYITGISKKGKKGTLPNTPRRDLELETLSEILRKERFITCHSYVQSEINTLMHVADSMGFTINTFTHILEGYKVADKMKAHGAGASSFSDWWAYKMEVKDAIPHNGALLWEQGVIVAFNSDDAEMARRLNQEAAKAVKYGGVPEEEALKFVTLNPAKLLHLDHRMGSIKVGKDADLVVWSDHPLSIYAKAEQTFVDGICYYDMNKDKEMDAWLIAERARLIQKMLTAKAGGESTQQPKVKEKKHFHCDTEDQTSIGIMNH
ncbi:MAG: amidohydrolase family protein [Flavobacteriales bacterium]|nr:amidohydrolase family protein [Flavobacteriales bacterium]